MLTSNLRFWIGTLAIINACVCINIKPVGLDGNCLEKDPTGDGLLCKPCKNLKERQQFYLSDDLLLWSISEFNSNKRIYGRISTPCARDGKAFLSNFANFTNNLNVNFYFNLISSPSQTDVSQRQWTIESYDNLGMCLTNIEHGGWHSAEFKSCDDDNENQLWKFADFYVGENGDCDEDCYEK